MYEANRQLDQENREILAYNAARRQGRVCTYCDEVCDFALNKKPCHECQECLDRENRYRDLEYPVQAAGDVVGVGCAYCDKVIQKGEPVLDEAVYKYGELDEINLYHAECK